MMTAHSFMVEVTCDGPYGSDVVPAHRDQHSHRRPSGITDEMDFVRCGSLDKDIDRFVHGNDNFLRKTLAGPVNRVAVIPLSVLTWPCQVDQIFGRVHRSQLQHQRMDRRGIIGKTVLGKPRTSIPLDVDRQRSAGIVQARIGLKFEIPGRDHFPGQMGFFCDPLRANLRVQRSCDRCTAACRDRK